MAVAAVPVHLKAALSVPETAALVGLSECSIRNLVNAGVLHRVPHTRRVLIARCEIDRWLSETEVAS